MKALLLKDIYTTIAKTKLFLIVILAFSFMGGLSLEGISASGFALYFSLLLPQNVVYYDETSHFTKFSKILPYSAFEIVFSKYLTGYLLVLCVGIISTISTILFNLDNIANIFDLLSPLFIISIFALSFFAVSLPPILIFGTQKGRFVMILLIMGFFFLMTSFPTLSPDLLFSLYNNIPLLFVAVILINIISIFISVTAYKKKRYLPS